jgi:hypothetical protein
MLRNDISGNFRRVVFTPEYSVRAMIDKSWLRMVSLGLGLGFLVTVAQPLKKC